MVQVGQRYTRASEIAAAPIEKKGVETLPQYFRILGLVSLIQFHLIGRTGHIIYRFYRFISNVAQNQSLQNDIL
jgi:hypothetical protein